MKMAKTLLNSDNLGFEAKLWQTADKLRSNMDAAEYKHVVLGLIFLKYISDAFDEKHTQLLKDDVADAEDPDEYRAENIFWVPKAARWPFLQKNAKQPTIGKAIDDAMVAIEKVNPSLKGVLPKDYARPALDKQRLGELIDLVGTIGLGDAENRARDILGRVYEYFLGQFAHAEGKKGGQFYTPRSIVRLLVEMLEPYKGRVYDPCCGSGGMFVQSEKFVKAHGGKLGDISIYGQESNPTTWRLCKMNLAIRGIEGNVGPIAADTFHNDLHKDLKADFVIANPPFNMSDWGGERLREDVRWRYGIPSPGSANFAWIQHFIHHLSPTGTAGFVLANGSLSSTSANDDVIRKNIIEADLVDCIVALPDKLFYNTPIEACLWFISRNKRNKHRDRSNAILFIDAREMGIMIDKTHKELNNEEIEKIAKTYYNWRTSNKKYADEQGFCKSVSLQEVQENKCILSPGIYVDLKPTTDDPLKFEERIKKIATHLHKRFKNIIEIEKTINHEFVKNGIDFQDAPIHTAPNTLLELIAQAIFKRWFIDFEFPNEANQPYKSNGGKLAPTKLGKIPLGWRISTIGNELETVLGGTPDRAEKAYWENGTIPWINSGELNKFRITRPSELITQEAVNNSATKLLPARTTVIAITGTTLGQISRVEIDTCANQSVIGIIESKDICSEYAYFWMKHRVKQIIAWRTGGAQQHINKNNVEDALILVPEKTIMDKYRKLVSPIFQLIATNSFDSGNL